VLNPGLKVDLPSPAAPHPPGLFFFPQRVVFLVDSGVLTLLNPSPALPLGPSLQVCTPFNVAFRQKQLCFFFPKKLCVALRGPPPLFFLGLAPQSDRFPFPPRFFKGPSTYCKPFLSFPQPPERQVRHCFSVALRPQLFLSRIFR